jgi:hypothetical protein
MMPRSFYSMRVNTGSLLNCRDNPTQTSNRTGEWNIFSTASGRAAGGGIRLLRIGAGKSAGVAGYLQRLPASDSVSISANRSANGRSGILPATPPERGAQRLPCLPHTSPAGPHPSGARLMGRLLWPAGPRSHGEEERLGRMGRAHLGPWTLGAKNGRAAQRRWVVWGGRGGAPPRVGQ